LRFRAAFVSNKNDCTERNNTRTDWPSAVLDKKKLHCSVGEQGAPHFRQDAPARFGIRKSKRFMEGVAIRKIPRAAFRAIRLIPSGVFAR
jgi:hypothetical protein